MKKIISGCIITGTLVACAVGVDDSQSAKRSSEGAFATPAAEQSFAMSGDMSKNLTDAESVSIIMRGGKETDYTRTAACTTSCTVSCTTSCTTCCSHRCRH